MKKIFTWLTAAMMMALASATFPVMAQEDIEEMCTAKAEKMNISEDKMDDFIEKCIEDAENK